MKEFKGTRGEHKPVYVSDVCIGIGVELEPNYNQMIVNTILPDTDKEYSKRKEEIEANVKLYCASTELLAACVEFVRKCECGEARSNRSYTQMKEAINKALGV